MQSYLIYIGLLIICYYVSKVAERQNKKKNIYIIIILLTFIAGFRGENVGIDTSSYITKFEYIANGQFAYAYGLETGFKLLCYVLLKVINSSTFLLLVFAFATNWLIVHRFWDFKDIASFPCMVVCYYISFYFATMNTMRQFLGVATIFYFTRLLKEQKYVRYIFVVAFTGLMIHQTALIGLGFLALEIFQWSKLTSKQRRLLLVGVFALPIVFVYVVNAMTRYERYFENVQMDIGFMVPVKIFFILLTAFVASGGNISKMVKGKENYEENSVRNYYFLGVLLAFLGYIFPYLERVGWYYYIFEGVYMGTLLRTKNRNNKMIYAFCLIALFGYTFILNLISKSQGVSPYLFVWQQ